MASPVNKQCITEQQENLNALNRQVSCNLQASLLLFHGTTLEAVRRIESTAAGFTNLLFSTDGTQLLATTADRRLLTYNVVNGTHILAPC